MTRKIIIDCDPGIDDAAALCIALFDPRLHVLAITTCAGTVDADQATHNATSIVGQLDPSRYPRIGNATIPENAPVVDDRYLNGADGLGGCNFEDSARQHVHTSDKVIAELLRKHPGEITIICLGPLTNLAKLKQRDPAVLTLVDKIVIGGGCVSHAGNVTAAAEFNMYFDPDAANDVFSTPTTKSLVPLDLCEQVSFGLELLDQIPSKTTRVGDLLHRLFTFSFRAAHQRLGREMIPLHNPATILSVLEPDLYSWEQLAGKVECSGELTRGMTVFDRRMRPEWPKNIEVAVGIDGEEAKSMLVRLLRYAGQET